MRPERPRRRHVTLDRWTRQHLELIDFYCALPMRGADAVRARIAPADDDHALAARPYRRRAIHDVSRDATILLRQVIHCEVNTGELAAGHAEIAGRLCAAREQDGVELV